MLCDPRPCAVYDQFSATLDPFQDTLERPCQIFLKNLSGLYFAYDDVAILFMTILMEPVLKVMSSLASTQ